jgi:hypothetical protein
MELEIEKKEDKKTNIEVRDDLFPVKEVTEYIFLEALQDERKEAWETHKIVENKN